MPRRPTPIRFSLLAAALTLPGCYLSHGLGGDDPGRPPDVPDGGFPDADQVPPPPPETPDEVRATCETGPLETDTLTVRFPARMWSCPWNAPPNSSPKEGRATARRDEAEFLDLPPAAILCDISLDFLGDEDDPNPILRYDDNFVLLFGDVVLAASDRSMVDRLERRGNLVLWNWLRIVDQTMATRGGIPWCLGQEEGLATCEIPPTEVPGPIELAFAEELVDELSLRAIERDEFVFRFVTIGDNDPVIDCGHEAFEFEVEASFVSR